MEIISNCNYNSKVFQEALKTSFGHNPVSFQNYADSFSLSLSAAKKYQLGQIDDGVRVISEKNVSDLGVEEHNSSKFDVAERLRGIFTQHTLVDNKKIDGFCQGRRGDCYLLSSIQSLKLTTDGQKILFDNIKKNPDGSFDITLPGAVKLRKWFLAQGVGEDCPITGKYRITKEAVEKAKKLAGRSYAYGDIEVIALELAIEAYRAEEQKNKKDLKLRYCPLIAGQGGTDDATDTLSAGFPTDATFIMTAQKGDIYLASEKKLKNIELYIPGKYGYVGNEKLFSNIACKIGNAITGLDEVNQVYNKESDLQKMLDKYKGKENEYAITVGVIVGQAGPDGVTKAGGGHALTVSKITDSYVEIINPWDTTKRERIPRGTFEKMAKRLDAVEISYDKYKKSVA